MQNLAFIVDKYFAKFYNCSYQFNAIQEENNKHIFNTFYTERRI